MDLARYQKILLLQTSFLGDTVLTLPLISEIKRRAPQAMLSVLCTPAGKELLQGHPEIDELIVDDKRGRDSGIAGLWRKAMDLKRNAFPVALSPHKSLRSAVLLALARVPLRVGFRQSKGWFLFHRLAERDPALHDVERNLSLLGAFGIPLEDCRQALRLPVPETTEARMKKILRSLGVELEKMLVGIHPGSVWPTKRWSVEGFAHVIRMLSQRNDCQVLLFGAPEDAPIAARIFQLCHGIAVNLAGKISLSDLPAALGICRLLITNDSGPMHIAVARGVPTVAIFCATSAALGFYPYAGDAVVVEKELACRPCGSHGGRRCPLGTEDCIRLISARDVAKAAEGLLARTSTSRAAAFTPEFMKV